MSTDKTTTEMEDMKAKLSILWVIVMFNMLTVDILSLYIPGVLEDMAELGGETEVSRFMLVAAILMEIPIAMIFLSRVLKYRVNRWANIIAGVITIVFVVGGGSAYPHYIFLGAIEVACMLLIIWLAWQWPNSEGQPLEHRTRSR